MKILHIFYGNNYAGGASYSMFNLVKYLNDDGYTVCVAVPWTPQHDMYLDLKGEGIETFEMIIPWWVWSREDSGLLGFVKNILKILFFCFMFIPAEIVIFWNIRKRNITVVHIGGAVICSGALSAIVLGLPLIWHLRELVEEDHNLRWIFRRFSRFLFAKADVLIPISNTVCEKYENMLNRKSGFCTIYNGVFESCRKVSKRQILLAPTIRLCFASGLSATKGIEVALEALTQMAPEDRQSFHLSIFGRANDNQIRHLQENIVKNKLENTVDFQGYTKNLRAKLLDQDIMLVCSQFEAFGRVTAEGMYAGCLVIGSDSGGTKELIGNSQGILFKVNDSKRLSNILLTVRNHRSEARNIAAIGQSYALHSFSYEVYCRDVEKIYNSIKEKQVVEV